MRYYCFPDITPLNLQKIEISLDPDKKEEREEQQRIAIQHYDTAFGALDLEKAYVPLFQLLWYSQLPCVDVREITSEAKDELSFMKRCYWKNKQINCNAIFQKRPTDRGMCCSFNIEKAEKIFKDSKYRTSISLRQTEEATKGFENDETPDWYTKNHEPVPNAGRSKGLTVIVDGHSNKLSPATVLDNFHGFVTIVDDKDKYPMASLSSIIARPGYESNVEVRAIHQHAHDEIRQYAPHRRNCYFPDEYELEMHQSYSRSNCLLECRVRFAFHCIATCMELGANL